MSGKEEAQPAIRTIAVIGAGSAGRSFALACARAGFHVILEDVMPANLRRASEQFEESRHSERVPLSGTSRGTPAFAFEIGDKTSGSLTTVLTVEDAVRTADLAIDFVPDELESKLEIFSMLDRMAPPRTVLLTPSDAQSITDLASCTYRPTLCFALRNFASPTPSDARVPHPHAVPLAGTRTGGKGGCSSLAPALPAHLVHPPSADESALTAVAAFLQALGYAVTTAQDTTAPMLIKNQPQI